MNDETKYQLWINKIAQDISEKFHDTGLIDHIKKHTVEEIDEALTNNELPQWIASLENLIEILKVIHNVTTDESIRLQRLQNKYDSDPSTYTGPPPYV